MSSEAFVELRGRRFAYLDFGGGRRDHRPTVLCLHGHFGRASIFAGLAESLADRYRVVALDQRGHGRSEKGGVMSPEEYVADAAAFITALGLAPAIVLGHSMGGAVGYLLAAREPALVRALVVADMTVLNQEPETRPVLDISTWSRRVRSRRELAAAIEARGIPADLVGYFLESAVEFEDGWGLLFESPDLMASQAAFVGDFSTEWAGSRQPALLLRGGESGILTAATARRMLEDRPGTRYVELPGCGHWVYAEDPEGFAAAVGDFLDHARPRGVAASEIGDSCPGRGGRGIRS